MLGEDPPGTRESEELLPNLRRRNMGRVFFKPFLDPAGQEGPNSFQLSQGFPSRQQIVRFVFPKERFPSGTAKSLTNLTAGLLCFTSQKARRRLRYREGQSLSSEGASLAVLRQLSG